MTDHPLIKDHTDVLSKISSEWDKAEATIKTAEMVSHDVIVPSISELRYGGRKLVDALKLSASGGPEERIEILLQDTLLCCKRARSDAIDAATTFIALNLEHLIENAGYRELVSSTPKFQSLFQQLQRVQEQITSSRVDRLQREQIYSLLEDSEFPKLIRDYYDVRSSEAVFRSVAKKRRQEILLANMFGVIGMLVGILSVLYAFLFR